LVGKEERFVLDAFNEILGVIDTFIWGPPLIALILLGGIFLTVRLHGLQFRTLGRALKYTFKNEEDGKGEVTSFGALCTAMSATVGTGNIVGIATAVVAGGPGALFWMWLAAIFGMATKFSEGLLAVKFRTMDKKGHVLGGPFYYIENGMGQKWRWLAKLFAFFGMCVGLFGIGTFTQVNSISSAVTASLIPLWRIPLICSAANIPLLPLLAVWLLRFLPAW
jgi:AGCS family alanine or glycine:cation symporter